MSVLFVYCLLLVFLLWVVVLWKILCAVVPYKDICVVVISVYRAVCPSNLELLEPAPDTGLNRRSTNADFL